MKALVVYEGNTDRVAQAICSGIKQTGRAEVECMPVNKVTAEGLAKADLWVLGGPSNGFLAGRKITGLLNKSAKANGKAMGATFDTRMAGQGSGIANKLASMMKDHNLKVISWTYFSLGSNKALMDGEEALAVTYGKNLTEMLK